MAVEPHRWGPNEKVMAPFNNEQRNGCTKTNGYSMGIFGGWAALACVGFAISAQDGG